MTFITAAPERVTTGAVVSTTFTVRDTEPVFPAASVLIYSRVYDPRDPVFTEPERINVASRVLPDPSTLSVQSAQASL